MVSVGRPATPSQPGSPGEGIQPEFLCQNRGKLCSSSALPSLAGEGMGGGWETGGWEKQPGWALPSPQDQEQICCFSNLALLEIFPGTT